MNLEPYFRSIPWAVPGTIAVAIAFAPCTPAAARAIGASGFITWLHVTAVGGFLSLTMTPTRGALDGYRQGRTYVSWAVTIPSRQELTSASDVSLNIVAGVALGAAGILLAREVHRRWPLMLVLAAPPAAELVQWLAPSLGRSGFLLTVVAQNWAGTAVGALMVTTVVAGASITSR